MDGILMPIKRKKSNKEGYENIAYDLFVCFQTGDRTPLFDLVNSDAAILDDTGAEAESLNEAKSQAWQFVTKLRQGHGDVIEDWGLW
ncbi:hypothetical protein [Microvirga arabica]|uniref:hypothetical protein n=1 Tax=Microvirga arabica TaxID=1128671 RepID=UPI001939E8F0|nr:hypothetical protein [Microvirga arabica]MBM1175063.1 hypothetical protein [Microvirga arabica]